MYRAIIVDDELTGINTLKILIERYTSNIKVVATATEPENGIKLIEDYKPDIIFLDISMPRINGFDLLDKLNYKGFKLVFTTAHEEFALKAIKNKAYDYLLKPIDIDELRDCISNITADIVENKDAPKTSLPSIIELNVKDGILFIKPSDIIRLEASGSYTTIYLANNEKHMASKNLKDYEAQLDPSSFYRCHTSHVVNLHKVVKLISIDGLYAKMSDDSLVEISRKNKQAFIEKLKNC